MTREKANSSHNLLVKILLATSFSVVTDNAIADSIIDGGMVHNVPSGTLFDAAGYLIVGENTFGQLSIASGGEAINTDAYIGDNDLSRGEVFVSGNDAKWTSSGYLSIGWDGIGIVMVDDGASIIVRDGTDLAAGMTSVAQLTLSGTAGAQGLLSTPYIMKGAGTGLLQWNGGVLQASRDELEFLPNFGFGDIDIQANGAFIDSNGFDIATQAVLSGAGGLTKIGAGTLTLKSNSSGVMGDSTVSEGTLVITGQLGSDAGTVDYTGGDPASTATAAVTGAGSAWDLTGNLSVGHSGAGALNIIGGATVSNFRGIIGYDGGSNGKVTVAGPGSVWNIESGLQVGREGVGELVISNGGAVVSISPWGDTIGSNSNSNGTASVTGPGSLWSATGLIVASQGTSTLTVSKGAVVSSAGDMWIGLYGGSGTLNIGGREGGSAVEAGFVAAPAINFGSGDGTLVFNHTDTNYVFSADLKSIDVAGGIGTHIIDHIAGSTTLTGNGSQFIGTMTVSGGTLAVNGTLGGLTLVQNGGTLGGSGTVGDTGIATGGTLAPGNSIGTLNIAGDVSFAPGSIYEVEVDAAGQSDKTVATGTATINSGTVRVFAGSGNYAPQSDYAILTANGGRIGTFAGVSSNLVFLTPSLGYDANNVFLTLRRNDLAFAGIGITPNQIATGASTESLGFSSPVYAAVTGLSAGQARAAFDQLSGEVHASAKGVLLEDGRFVRAAVTDRLRAAFDSVGASTLPLMAYGEGGPQLAPADTERFAAWGSAFGSWGHTDGDGNAASLKRSTGGFFMGADGSVFETWRLGLMAGYSHSSFQVNDRAASGSSDNYHLGAYAGTQWGNLGFRSGLAYSWHDLATGRAVGFPGFADNLTSNYRAGTFQAFGELGYRIDTASVAFEPFANLAYVNLHTGSFTEQGGAAALTSSSGQMTDTTFSTLGLRASTSFELGGMQATARGMLGWRHASNTLPFATHSFAGGDSFTVAGAPIARDAAMLEAGLDLDLTPAATFGVSYSGQIASGAQDHGFNAKFKLSF